MITLPPQVHRPIRRILLVYKRSVYQKYVLDEDNAHIRNLMRSKDVTARTLKDAHRQHHRALDSVIDELSRHRVPYDVETRHRLQNLDAYDMVFSVGGDGTLLRTSHFIRNQRIMGINSSTRYSVGALCSVTHDKFRTKLEDIMAGRYRIKRVYRMRVAINGRRIPILATNDVLYTNISPAATSRYLIQYGRVREEHKSSGIWISTPIGSTAAIHAAGGVAQKLSERRLQFKTREPYQGIYSPYKLIHGYVPARRKLVVLSKMVNAMVFVDGPNDAYRISYGDRVEFTLAGEDLHVIE